MLKGIFQKGVYEWLPLNGFSKAFKRSLVISTAGLGVIFTAGLIWQFLIGFVIRVSIRMGLIKLFLMSAKTNLEISERFSSEMCIFQDVLI